MSAITAATNSAAQTAMSGLQAAQVRMDTAAFNVANLPTEGFKRSIVTQQTQPSGGVKTVVSRRQDAGEGYLEDRVEQIQAMYDFKANLKTLQTSNEMIGSLLDIKA